MPADASRTLSLLGVPVRDCTLGEALDWIGHAMEAPEAPARRVYFVNAHTLNLAWEDAGYRRVLASADQVYGDGTGVRWAARILHGARMRDNVNGTDLVPALFARFRDRGLRCFLLGATPEAIERAVAHARRAFPGWDFAGHHHGYLDSESTPGVLASIAAARPHLLLVGMGNPRQERWLAEHGAATGARVCMGTGGLFDYWAGDLVRAPAWVRRLGAEWVHLLLRQPRKFERYVLGNPAFLLRLLRVRYGGHALPERPA